MHFSICVFLNLCFSQSVRFSISVFLNLCDSQSVRFSICAFLNLCDSQLVLFSISVFLNLCDSQLVFFSICAILNLCNSQLVFFSIKAIWARHRQLDDSLVGQLTKFLDHLTVIITCFILNSNSVNNPGHSHSFVSSRTILISKTQTASGLVLAR